MQPPDRPTAAASCVQALRDFEKAVLRMTNAEGVPYKKLEGGQILDRIVLVGRGGQTMKQLFCGEAAASEGEEEEAAVAVDSAEKKNAAAAAAAERAMAEAAVALVATAYAEADGAGGGSSKEQGELARVLMCVRELSSTAAVLQALPSRGRLPASFWRGGRPSRRLLAPAMQPSWAGCGSWRCWAWAPRPRWRR